MNDLVFFERIAEETERRTTKQYVATYATIGGGVATTVLGIGGLVAAQALPEPQRNNLPGNTYAGAVAYRNALKQDLHTMSKQLAFTGEAITLTGLALYVLVRLNYARVQRNVVIDTLTEQKPQ